MSEKGGHIRSGAHVQKKATLSGAHTKKGIHIKCTCQKKVSEKAGIFLGLRDERLAP